MVVCAVTAYRLHRLMRVSKMDRNMSYERSVNDQSYHSAMIASLSLSAQWCPGPCHVAPSKSVPASSLEHRPPGGRFPLSNYLPSRPSFFSPLCSCLPVSSFPLRPPSPLVVQQTKRHICIKSIVETKHSRLIPCTAQKYKG